MDFQESSPGNLKNSEERDGLPAAVEDRGSTRCDFFDPENPRVMKHVFHPSL